MQLSASRANETEAAQTVQLLQTTRDELTSKLTSLEEGRDLLQSELSSVQSDLATANSQANTQLLAMEKVCVCMC